MNTMPLLEYIKQTKAMQNGKKKVLKVTISDIAYQKLTDIAERADLDMRKLAASMIVQCLLQYDYEHYIIPQLKVIVDEKEID